MTTQTMCNNIVTLFIQTAKYKCRKCGDKWKMKNSRGSPKTCEGCGQKGIQPYDFIHCIVPQPKVYITQSKYMYTIESMVYPWRLKGRYDHLLVALLRGKVLTTMANSHICCRPQAKTVSLHATIAVI